MNAHKVTISVITSLALAVASGCNAASGNGATSPPLTREARSTADRFLAALVPRASLERARGLATADMAAEIPDLIKTLKRAGIREPKLGRISTTCGATVAAVPVPGGTNCVVYRLFGRTREPRMDVENRATLRFWLVKIAKRWKVSTYDYHARVRVIPR